VLVVDNASADGTIDQIPSDPLVRVIANRENHGFAGGVNQGVREANAPLILLLNPDTVLMTPIDPLVTAIVANGHSGAAGMLVDERGNPQNGFTFRRLPTPLALAFEVLGINRIWPGNPVNRRYRCLDLDPQQAQEVEQPAGAFLLFRRSDWERLGGFDEGFHPVWFEDVDFCRRLLDAGGSIWFDPSVRARHHGGHSVQKIELGCRQRTWYGSLLRYAAKHYSPSSRRIVAGVVALAVLPRLLYGLQVSSIKSIWRMAWKCFQTGGSWEGPAV
jgi:N-acetylglucosaminyl-diphospho-decaprenol L-rhamnosyltransferase